MNQPVQKKSKNRRIFEIIQLSNTSDLPSKLFDYFLVVLIISTIVFLFFETFDEFNRYYNIFKAVETFALIVFCIEYALRIWTAEYLYPGRSKFSAAMKFICSFDGIIELLTIIPVFFLSGAVTFRMLRVVRIFHLFRINANYDSFNVITAVLYEKRNQIASSLFIVFILMLASSLCMYNAEHEAQPEAFGNALSCMWWSVNALLTIGYGDVVPVTPVGKVLAVIISFLGVGIIAIPTGIISAGFVEQYHKAQGGTATFDSSIFSISVSIDSGWLNKSVEYVHEEYGALILMIRRGNERFQPEPDTLIALNDRLCVYIDKHKKE